MGRVTVFEVAAEAGVSLATVDRVINGRKGVRQPTIHRVQTAVQKLGFRRDAYAAALATRKRERYVFVLPAPGRSLFIDRLRERVRAAMSQMADQRVLLSIADYTPFDEGALCSVLDKLDTSQCDGIALMAIDSPLVRREIDSLADKGIPVVTLVSDISPSRRQCFVGIDNKAAGRVAASLIGRMAAPGQGSVGLILGKMTLHDHAERRVGFEQVLTREFPQLTLLPTLEGADDNALTEIMTRQLLDLHDDMVGLYSAGAGNRGVIRSLRNVPDKRLIVVAHELTPHVRDALLSGTITAVLHQDQAQEVASALGALRAIVGSEERPTMRTIRSEIFLRDNVPDLCVA